MGFKGKFKGKEGKKDAYVGMIKWKIEENFKEYERYIRLNKKKLMHLFMQ